MRILIIGPGYEPDLGPAAPLFTMLSRELVKLGHQVTVITWVPHYPTGRVPVEYRGKLFWRSIESGVSVIRIGLPSVNRSNLSQRLLQIICYQIGATYIVMSQPCDAVLSVNPSLVVLLPFFWLVKLRHKPAVYSVHDVYPDVGVQLGIFRHKLVIKTVAYLERFCLNNAKVIRILSESFRPGIRNLGVRDTKMKLVYDWVDTKLIQPLSKSNSFVQENNLSGKFVVLYAGNIGLSQGLELLLTTASMLAEQKDIQFVFVGDGGGREFLQTQTKLRQLTNVQFISFQPRERLSEVLASADVSLVILRRGIGLASLPSKTFSIMASGRPILVSVDEESETKKLVIQANAGVWVPPEDAEKLATAILSLKQDRELCERLGQNGRIWAEKYHSPQSAAEQFENLLSKAISASDNRH